MACRESLSESEKNGEIQRKNKSPSMPLVFDEYMTKAESVKNREKLSQPKAEIKQQPCCFFCTNLKQILNFFYCQN
jgi:hypothetical protein